MHMCEFGFNSSKRVQKNFRFQIHNVTKAYFLGDFLGEK